MQPERDGESEGWCHGDGDAGHAGGRGHQALMDRLLGADAVDGLLHFAMSAVAPLDRVGCGWKQRIVQKGQRLLQGRTEELLQDSTNALEAPDVCAKLEQLGDGGSCSAASIEKAVCSRSKAYPHDLYCALSGIDEGTLCRERYHHAPVSYGIARAQDVRKSPAPGNTMTEAT